MRENHVANIFHFQNVVLWGSQVGGYNQLRNLTDMLTQKPAMHMDSGTLTPTGAISSLPYTPEDSMKALMYFYRVLGDETWDIYGFKDAINLDENWMAPQIYGAE